MNISVKKIYKYALTLGKISLQDWGNNKFLVSFDSYDYFSVVSCKK